MSPTTQLLIAFLKQMEFSTLTRRVAEFAELDSGAIEPSTAVVPKTDRPAAAPPRRSRPACRSPAAA